jgi:iron complex outermembrane receptor protein
MKKLVFLQILLFLLVTAYGQISGRVKNREEQALAGVTIFLVSLPDSMAMHTMVTDSLGHFSIGNIARGSFFLRFHHTAMIPYETNAFRSDSTGPVTLDIVLLPNIIAMEDVMVRATRPITKQTPYGTVLNVESSILSKASTALELLQRAPGVSIDYRNGGISLNGKDGVLVMIDGKTIRLPLAQVMNMLSAMNGNDIARIELLNTPPAGYDADGSAGIIHIILKKNSRQGTSGSLTATAGHGWGPKAGASLQLTRRSGKLQIAGSYSYSLDRTRTDLDIESSQDMPVFGGRLDVSVLDTSKATQQNHNAGLGIDYEPDSMTRFGVQTTAGISRRALTVRDFSVYHLYPDSILFFNSVLQSRNNWNNYSISVYLDKKIKRNQSLNISADYLGFDNDNPSFINNRIVNKAGIPPDANDSIFSPLQRGFALTRIDVGAARLDYSIDWAHGTRLQTGIKGTLTESRSRSGIETWVSNEWVYREETLNSILMREKIGAAYLQLNIQLAKKLRLVAGSRYEYALVRMRDPESGLLLADRRLGKLFPSLFLTHSVGEQQEFQLSYSERITRPSYNDLASFVRYADATAVYTGNPSLRPTVSRNIKLGYALRDHQFSLVFSRDENAIAYYQITESPNRNLLYVSPQNLRYINIVNAQLSSSWKPVAWWQANTTVSGGWRQFAADHTPVPVKYGYWSYALSVTNSFTLPRQYGIELSGWFNGAGYNGTTRTGSMGAANFGIRKDLPANAGRLQLAITDIFRTLRINSYYGTVTKEAFSIRNTVSFQAESRFFPIVKLSYSRSFGTAQTSRNKESASNEENKRINKD